MTDATTLQVTESPSYLTAVLRGGFHAISTLGGAIMTGLAGTEWEQCDTQTKFLIVVGIIVSCSSTAAAYFDRTMARMSDGKAAIASGNTPPPFAVPPAPPKLQP